MESVDWNAMVKDFNDPLVNSYDEGPGAQLPVEHQPIALANKSDKENRQTCGLYLNYIPKGLKEKGLLNYCNKYGRVEGAVRLIESHRGYNYAFVEFGSVE